MVLLVAIVAFDIATQASLILNQTRLLSIDPATRSRMNTAFVTGNFIGGALGSALAGVLWQAGGWTAVLLGGAAALTIALLVWATNRRTLTHATHRLTTARDRARPIRERACTTNRSLHMATNDHTAGLAAELAAISDTEEVHVSSRRADGTMSPGQTIWAVVVDGSVFIRSTDGPDKPWFRAAKNRGVGRLQAGDAGLRCDLPRRGRPGPVLDRGRVPTEVPPSARLQHQPRGRVDGHAAATARCAADPRTDIRHL